MVRQDAEDMFRVKRDWVLLVLGWAGLGEHLYFDVHSNVLICVSITN